GSRPRHRAVLPRRGGTQHPGLRPRPCAGPGGGAPARRHAAPGGRRPWLARHAEPAGQRVTNVGNKLVMASPRRGERGRRTLRDMDVCVTRTLGFGLLLVSGVLVASAGGGSPPSVVTTDTPEYCQKLIDRIS